jgi:chromosome partitioning protein
MLCYNAVEPFSKSTRSIPVTRTIAVANQKGGVGKTTTVSNLGASLAAMGKRVLLIDLDPQAALTATYGLDPYKLPRSMYSVLVHEGASLARVLHPAGKSTNLSIAPASIDLAAAEVQLANSDNRAHRLRNALEQNRIPFDYILIDTPPSLGLLTLNGLVGANEVLVPVQAHFLAMRGVRALMEVIWRVKRRLNPQLRLLGLVPTMYQQNSDHAREVVDQMRDVFKTKVFDVLIYNDMAFAEAPVAHKSLVEQLPEHQGALAYRKLAEVIANHE